MLLLCVTLHTLRPTIILTTAGKEEVDQRNIIQEVTVAREAEVTPTNGKAIQDWDIVQLERREGRRIDLM